jgi:hypothetical protein
MCSQKLFTYLNMNPPHSAVTASSFKTAYWPECSGDSCI